MANIYQRPRWAVIKQCPVRDEMIAAFSDDRYDVNAMVYRDGSWGNMIEPVTDLGTYWDRPFYFAYEQLSGDGLLCFRQNDDNRLYFRTWNGTSWSGTNSTVSISTNRLRWVKMIPKPNSNEIFVGVLGTDRDLIALVWNGSSFTSILQVETAAAFTGEECFDVAYERLTGRAMIAWARDNSNQPWYRIWTGSAWLATASASSIGAKARWVRLASDPASNKIILMALDDTYDVNAVVWSGSAWGVTSAFASDSPSIDRRTIDVAFELGGTNAIAMYGRTGQTTLRYRTYNGAAWSAELVGPSIAQVPGVIQLQPSSGRDVMVGILEANASKLHFTRWTGTGFSDTQMLVADVAGDYRVECFMFACSSAKPRLIGWSEVQP
jgi:hypothetical protein